MERFQVTVFLANLQKIGKKGYVKLVLEQRLPMPRLKQAVRVQPLLLQQKKPARPGTVHDHGQGTVQPQQHSTTKSTKKARRAKRRFEALDANGDGVLSFEELQGHGTTDRTVATSERR